MTDNNERSLSEIKEDVQLQQFSAQEEEVYALPESPKNRSMLWSILALASGILSILVAQVWVLSIILAIISIGLSVFARLRLGFFDKIAIFGLITAIVGTVFGVFSAIVQISGVFGAL